jgi:tetratricopeptide (TPR) repeat protein
LGFYDLREILESPPPPHQDTPDVHRKAGLLRTAAWIEAFRGDYDRALRAVKEIEDIGADTEWEKAAADLRAKIGSLREGSDDPAKLGALISHVQYAQESKQTQAFALLKRLRDGPAAPGSPRRVAGRKAMAAVLMAAGDVPGATAVEDSVFKEPDASIDDLAGIVWKRSHVPLGPGYLEPSPERYRKAEEGYRRILREWPDSQFRKSALESLGDLLLVGNHPAEARKAFQRLLEEEVESSEDPGPGRILLPDVRIKIGRTFEAEGAWEKALESYRDGSVPGAGTLGGCGTCIDQRQLASRVRITRCLGRLNRHDEVMSLCREVLFESDGGTGGVSVELCLIAVDTAIQTRTLDGFQRDLKNSVGPDHRRGHIKTTMDYISLLRLQAEGDFAGLYSAFSNTAGYNDWHQYRWQPRSALYVEALECLATLGDPALDFLIAKVKPRSRDSERPLIAIAHFRNARAIEFIRSDKWKAADPGDHLLRMLERIHAAPARKREYLPSTRK